MTDLSTRIPFIARGFATALAGALIALSAVAASAQEEMSADEMRDAFDKQRTRGLVLVPSGETTSELEDTSSAQVAAASSDYQPVDNPVNVRISFDFDSAALREDQKPKLATLCGVMKSVDVKLFQIIGHTDSAGSAEYNENLSKLRAEEVKRHLVNDCGIDAARLEAIGVGESAPVNAADPRSDENRRVEFQALG